MSTAGKIVVGVVFAMAVMAGAVYFGIVGQAQRVEAAIAIGSDMPAFELKDSDGKTHKFADYTGKIVVVQFSSQHCPWSRAADSDFEALQGKYKDRGVVVIGVDSHKSTSAEDIAKHRTEAGISFAILKDEMNQYADAVGANQTPEVVIVDKDGKVAYHGAFDDRKEPEGDATKNYVADAVEALLAGKKPEPSKTQAWGCGIKRT